MGKVADIARIREILAENLLLRHKLRLLAYKDPKHRDTLLPEAPHLSCRVMQCIVIPVRLWISRIRYGSPAHRTAFRRLRGSAASGPPGVLKDPSPPP